MKYQGKTNLIYSFETLALIMFPVNLIQSQYIAETCNVRLLPCLTVSAGIAKQRWAKTYADSNIQEQWHSNILRFKRLNCANAYVKQ